MYVTTIIGMVYAVYAILVFTMMGLFCYGITSKKKIALKFKISIYVWITFLIVSVYTFHIMMHLKSPASRLEILSGKLMPKKVILINIADYLFDLPENPIKIKAGEPVRFDVSSQDVTYGFGVFRSDGTLAFQMQVVPGRPNRFMWIFHETGKYTIRSTEYSGPENWKMVLKDAIIVEGRDE